MLLLPQIVTGLLRLSQTVTPVMVAGAGVEGAGSVAPWSGGLKLQIGAPQLVVGVVLSVTGLMTTQVNGEPYCNHKW